MVGRLWASSASELMTGITLLLAIGPPNGRADLEVRTRKVSYKSTACKQAGCYLPRKNGRYINRVYNIHHLYPSIHLSIL